MTDTKALRKDDGDLAKSYGRNDIPDLYQQGHSLNQVSRMTGVSYPTVRRDLIAAGVEILSKKDGVARFQGGWNNNRRGGRRPEFSEEWRENMRVASVARWSKEGRRDKTTGRLLPNKPTSNQN